MEFLSELGLIRHDNQEAGRFLAIWDLPETRRRGVFWEEIGVGAQRDG